MCANLVINDIWFSSWLILENLRADCKELEIKFLTLLLSSK